jgi:hypothetical protein
MQKIESIKDGVNAALAVGRRLSVGEARQSGRVDAAELAVERRGRARIFGRPIEPVRVNS